MSDWSRRQVLQGTLAAVASSAVGQQTPPSKESVKPAGERNDLPAPPTLELRKLLIQDLQSALHAAHARMAKARASGERRADRGYAYMLAAMSDLHRETRDAHLLEWAAQDMMWMVQSAIEPDGKARPFITSFRNLQPFCQAYIYLRGNTVLTPEDQRKVEDQIRASVGTHYDYADWGAQNRATVDGASFLFAAAAIPSDPEASRWRKYGDALLYDSWGKWSIEDASIYNPFWLFYLLTAAEVRNQVDELMNFITTRYYFEYYSRLAMPNGMLPDWGDGDWTYSWQWFFADMVRAGSYYRNGRYLYFARKLYSYYMGNGPGSITVSSDGVTINKATGEKLLTGDAIYCAGAALGWLDTSVTPVPYEITASEELVEDLVAKKIVFRNDKGDHSTYAMLNYRDLGSYARYQRDYQNQQLAAYEEKLQHGHADENSINVLFDNGTVLLHDGGYRQDLAEKGWRADAYHNRIVARAGWPENGDVFSYLLQQREYQPVKTEKIHFGTFGALDYSRTRLVDEPLGYTADRIVLFAPSTEIFIIVDSIRIDRPGPRLFVNVWHPDGIIREGENHVVSWPSRIPIRTEYWPNQHQRDLLIQFLDSRDKPSGVKEILRDFNLSKTFFQHLSNYFFTGQHLTFTTVLRPHAAGSFSEAMLNKVQVISGSDSEHRTLGLRFEIEGQVATVGFKLDQTIGLTNLRGRPMFDFETGAIGYGDMRTDADFAFVLDRGMEVEYGFVNGSSLSYAGKTLFDMPLNNQMYQGIGDFRAVAIKDKMPRYHDVVKR